MAYFVIQDFSRGRDVRRQRVVSPTGTLWECRNAHINRGGEVEKRKAFVGEYSLPIALTHGLAVAQNQLYVFGSANPSTFTMPPGVTYQRLQHPNGTTDMSEVLQVEVFKGKLYVVAEFADGTINHYYDGARITDWFDGRARGQVEIVGGVGGAAVAAQGAFQITGGTNDTGVNVVAKVYVDGIDVLGAVVDWDVSNSATASAVAAQINSFVSVPNYNAAAVGNTVTITAATAGAAQNGKSIVIDVAAGNVTTSILSNMNGGADVGSITKVLVNGINIINAPVAWTASNTNTASLLAGAINSYASSPEYTASADGQKVNILATAADGATPNGYAISVVTTGSVSVNVNSHMANGQAPGSTFAPGRSVRTFGAKMYAVSGSFMHFSAVNGPIKFNTDAVGAGFIDMASHEAGSEELTGLRSFFSLLGVWAKSAIQLWHVESDDLNNDRRQTIENTGTYASKSIQPFGDSGDVFYLSLSGIRSLRSAKDVNNNAIVADVGTPIDPDVVSYVATLPDDVKAKALSVVEPTDQRLWMAINDRIFVFSYYAGSQISAWSEYAPGFVPSDFAVLRERLYVRSGDTIYLYGGADNNTYDSSVVEVVTPFFDAKTLATYKDLRGIDTAVQGTWTVEQATDPRQPNEYEMVAVIDGPTFELMDAQSVGRSTHVAYRFTNDKAERALISNFVVHYDGAQAG